MQSLDINGGLPGESNHRQVLQVLLLLIVAAAVFVTGIGKLALVDPDEGRYALIGRNMVERHNYLEPWLGGEYYAKKPALFFDLLAGSFRLFGPDNPQFAARIVPVAGALLTILATYLVAASLFSHTIGLISAGCLLSSVVMIGFGKFVRMDLYLVAFMTLAFWAFIKGYKTRQASPWFLLMYPLLGLAVLIKGPIGLGLFGAILGLFLVWQTLIGQGDVKVVGHVRLILGLAILIVIAGPWFLYMATQHEGFAWQFFGIENFDRVLHSAKLNEPDLGHHNTPLLYVATLIVGWLPWTGLQVLAVARYGRSAWNRGSTDWESRLLMVWFGFVLLFFMAVPTRLFHYVLPAFVPASILLGRFLYDYWQSDFPRRRRQLSFAWAYGQALVAACLVVLMYVAAAFGSHWLQWNRQWANLPDLYAGTWWGNWGWMVTLIYRLAAAVMLAKLFWYLWRRWQLPQLVIGIAAGFLVLMVDISYVDFPRIFDLLSCRRLAPLVRQNYDSGTVIIEGPVTASESWSLPFYLGKSYPIKHVSHFADMGPYFKNTGRMIYLCHDDYVFNQTRMALGRRVVILTQFGSTRLLLIRECEPTVGANRAEDGTKPASALPVEQTDGR